MTPIFANVIQNAFSPLISVFKAILVFLHDNVTAGSWGLAIIGLTIVVRAALVPLTVKQFSSMAKLQALGPDIKALQARHKDDKQRLNEEMMKFYRENQVNPFSSCLPLVLQFPVFISLFYMLRTDLKVQICGAQLTQHMITTTSAIQKASCGKYGLGKFLFIPDITAPAHGAVLILLIVLYIGSQLVSSLLTTATVDRNQRLIALGLPFLFTIFIIGFPSGLILYWITTNLWTVGQQYIVRRYFPPANLPAGAGKPSLSLASLFARDEPATAKAGAGGGKGGGAAAKAAKPSGRGGAAPTTKGGASTKGGATTKGAGATKGGATTKGGAAAKEATKPAAGGAVKRQPAAKATSGAAGRRKGATTDASANGTAGKERAAEVAREAKEPPAPRPGGSAPPPPPRKKKKRSGRRR